MTSRAHIVSELRKNFFYSLFLAGVYDDGVDLPRGHPHASDYEHLPTAHEVSRNVFTSVTDQTKNDKNMSVLFMTFGQFLDHDIAFSPHEECNVTE